MLGLDLVSALVAFGHASIVIRKAEAENADADALEPFGKAHAARATWRSNWATTLLRAYPFEMDRPRRRIVTGRTERKRYCFQAKET